MSIKYTVNNFKHRKASLLQTEVKLKQVHKYCGKERNRIRWLTFQTFFSLSSQTDVSTLRFDGLLIDKLFITEGKERQSYYGGKMYIRREFSSFHSTRSLFCK